MSLAPAVRQMARPWALAAAVLFSAVGCAQAQSAVVAAPALAPVEILDLPYGDVLFHFYQEDYFEALTRLQAASLRAGLAHHAADAQLLEGALYLSLGQHREAGEIFAQVLGQPNVPVAVRDQARFYLGKVRYQRGYFDEAIEVLNQPSGHSLPADRESERRLVLAEALMAKGQNEQAVSTLANLTGSPAWMAYVRFNRGVALIRSGQTDAGVAELDAVGRSGLSGSEGAALKDKANLAAGYALIQANLPARALPYLERVRLEGPLSSRALLGAGWAQSATGDSLGALTPWLELRGRSLLDAAVQESYLAVPYAYTQLGAQAEAARYYQEAVTQFTAESARIDQSIEAIKSGALIETLLAHDGKGDMSGGWQLNALPDSPQSRYLHYLLASHEFQESLKNYRQLQYLSHNVAVWTENLQAYENMISTRRARYSQQSELVQSRLTNNQTDSLRTRTQALQSRLSAAQRSHDVEALATAQEQERYQQIEALQLLAEQSGDEDAEEARAKLKLMKGVVTWQMETAYKAREWVAQKDLRETNQSLREAERNVSELRQAVATVPDRDAALGLRVAALTPRLGAVAERLEVLKARDAKLLAQLAVSELASQKTRLQAYSVQARYALATLYDRAAVSPAQSTNPSSTHPDTAASP